MSMSPVLLSRRSLLRGAASVTVVAALAAISSCAGGESRPADDLSATEDGSGALLRLGHAITDRTDAAALPAATDTGPISTDEAAVRAVDAQADSVRADFVAGRTVGAQGWLLSATEATVLVAYADGCPLPAC